MTEPPSKVQRDFDRIASLSDEPWDHNSHYHSFLLSHIPPTADSDALEIGCGTGAFSRLLAQRFRRVLALDLSPRMIEIARERSRPYPNIDFQVADAVTVELPSEQFGCVASIATLHHLPLEIIFPKIKSVLKPGGTLLVLDLFRAQSVADFSTSLLSIPLNTVLRWIKCGRVRQSAEARAAWEEHARTDTYPTLAQVRRACAAIFPAAQVKRHLLWRYSVVWKKE